MIADKPDLNVLLKHLEAEGRVELDAALTIMIRGRELTAREPNMIEIATPITIVGDLHGQFYDMVCDRCDTLHHFPLCCRSKCLKKGVMWHQIGEMCKDPSRSVDHSEISGRYLFLGDYVDRGQFSVEIVLYLWAVKIAHPDSFFLLRGNHECNVSHALIDHLFDSFLVRSSGRNLTAYFT